MATPTSPVHVLNALGTDEDVRRAASYLSSCFVCCLNVKQHELTPPNNAIIAAPALIRQLHFQFCDFYSDEQDVLSETLNGSTFQSLAIVDSAIPGIPIATD